MSEGARASREAAIAEDLGRRTAEAQAREALLRAGEAEAALARYILIKLRREGSSKNYKVCHVIAIIVVLISLLLLSSIFLPIFSRARNCGVESLEARVRELQSDLEVEQQRNCAAGFYL